MAISLIAKPYAFSPAFNPLKFIYDSTNKNNRSFKYIFDVYLSGTATKIAEYRSLPLITTGYGEQDLSKLLQSKVSFDFLPTLTSSQNAPNSFYKYDVKVGEEYVTQVSYTASVTQNGSYVKITATHAFVVGDQVRINQADSGTANPGLEGLFTVTAVTGTTDFTVNSLWSLVTDATINGTVYYADERKTVTRDVITSTNNYVFNGAFSFRGWDSYNEANYLLTANTDLLLTTLPQTGFKATVNQDLWINIGNNSVTTGYMYFQNSNGDILRKTITNANPITQVGVGANNSGTLSVVSGTNPLVKSDTTYYDFWYANSAGVQHSVKYRIEIDRRCEISEYEIAFLDRLGSFGSFAFQLRSYERGNVTKETYNQDVAGSVSSSKWGYDTYEQGQRVLSPRIEETIELNTNYMSEEMSTYFSELLSSPATYIKIDDVYYSCIVQTTSYEKNKQVNKNLIKKTIEVKLSNQTVING